MASTSSSASTQRSSSPPPQESSLRDPFQPEINPPPRNHLEERVSKRRRIEEGQDKSLIHGLELQQHAAKFLESNDLSLLREAIDEYTQTKKESLMKIFKSFAHHYPNAFSLKLAKILELHPPLQTRTETVALILHTLPRGINSSMSLSILIELKNPIFNSLKVESEEILFPSLCEMIGLFADRLYRFSHSSWVELLQYVCDCISGAAKSNNKKGLMLLTEFSVIVVQNREFWQNQGNLDLVFSNILKLINSTDQELKALAFSASLSLMILSNDLQRTDVCDFLLPILLNIIDQHPEEEVLVNRVKRLSDLVMLDDGNIFNGKLGEVFWCMIRIAEIEDVSEELRFVAVNVIKELEVANLNAMESLIENLSHEEVRRVIAVAMNLLLCAVDDPLWYDVDDKNCNNAGMTEAFYHGVLLFKSLTLDGDEDVFVPTAIEMMTKQYASHTDSWFRYAAMLVIGWIAERNIKGDMMQYFNQVAMLVLKSLDDLNPRVLWATIHAITWLSEHKELLMRAHYHKKFLEKLVPIIRCNSCARVQTYAVIAIRSLVKNCGLDKISPFGETIVASLLVFLKHEKQKLQFEAIDTLKLFAVLMPGIFRQKYYNTAMEALKVIVFDKYSLPKLLLRAKCLELMVHLVREVGPNNFEEQEAFQVVQSVISLDGKLSNTEYLTKCTILKTLDQICRCPKVSINKFIDKIMPMLLGSAQPRRDLTVDKLKDDDQKNLVETMIVQACDTLSYCAVRSSINFSPHIDKVITMFMRFLGCSNFQLRKASILGLPNLLISLKVSDKDNDTKSGLTFWIVRCLIEVLKKETNRVLSTIVLRLLARSIQICSSLFNDQLIEIIANEIKDTIRKIITIQIMKDLGTSEGRCESLPTEDTLQVVVHLIKTTIDTFKDRFMLHVDDLMSNVVVFLANDNPDILIAFAISIFNVIFPLFPDKLPPYHDRYILASCFALRKNYPYSKLYATRAIGICAMFGGEQFKASASEGILRLNNVMSKRLAARNVTTLCDTAVAALGKIYEFHCDNIGPKAVQKWLSFLPLKHDFNEARYAHGLLSKLIQRSDGHLFGSYNENLPKIISVVKEILSGPNRLGTEEAINQMIDFIDQHGGMGIGTEEASSTISSQTHPPLIIRQ